MTSERRVLAVVAAPGTAGAVRGLVRALSAIADVRSLGRCPSPPAAVLATSADVLGRVPAGLPVAVWVEESSLPVPDGVIAVGPHVGGDGVTVPSGGIDLARLPPIGPAVRRRWRQRFDLPADWILDCDVVAAADRKTALALCAAAVVADEDLLTALALGAPTVTTSEGARAIGAHHDVHVVVSAPGADPLAEAADLATDQYRAARLSAAGRALVEGGFDLGAGARHLAERLGLTEPLAGATALLEARLAELDTPAASRVRIRAASATAVLTGASP